MFGARPARLPLSIGDPTIVTGATAVTSMFELFSFYLQGGLIDVGFLGAAQIDRFGNINTTVIGDDYDHPKTRLPGSGGACEIAINARQVFVIMRQSKRSFVERIDFRTSPGNLGGAENAARIRPRAGLARAAGRRVVVTDLGIYHFDETARCASTRSTRAPRSRPVRETIGWEPRVAARPGDDAGADRRGAAAHPGRARSGGRLHEVTRTSASAECRRARSAHPRGVRLAGRTTRTGQPAWWTTWSETLPSRNRPTVDPAVGPDHDEVGALGLGRGRRSRRPASPSQTR